MSSSETEPISMQQRDNPTAAQNANDETQEIDRVQSQDGEGGQAGSQVGDKQPSNRQDGDRTQGSGNGERRGPSETPDIDDDTGDSPQERQAKEEGKSDRAKEYEEKEFNDQDNAREGVNENAGGSGNNEGVTSKLQVHNLSKSFGSAQVMKNINFDFVHDAITTVLGPSGTGKSVLIKHLVGLLEPDSGEVLVDGDDIWQMSEDERYAMRTRFGVCWQDGALFGSMNIYDNTAFPLRTHTKMSESEIEERVMGLLEEVGLGHSAHKAPNEISGGMKKRAGFARALVMDPEFVIFDEPDSGLDPVRTSLLCDIILDVHQQHGGTYLLVTHDMATARKVSDYIGLIWQGEVVHYGPAKEAFENEDPFVKQFLAGESAGPLGMD